jgi:ABC-type proline/glycine betaine transport system substrate-binding protein
LRRLPQLALEGRGARSHQSQYSVPAYATTIANRQVDLLSCSWRPVPDDSWLRYAASQFDEPVSSALPEAANTVFALGTVRPIRFPSVR